MATTRREPQRVRRARRRAAYHADRARKATTPAQRYRVAEDALVSAVAHAPQPAGTARTVHGEVAEHARKVLERLELGSASAALAEHHLSRSGTERQRLAAALMCLRGLIARLPDTERDRLYEHYARHLDEEAHRISTQRGDW
ncbi:hypothetical protein DFQ14_103102 [Halopolyspora algeriensis]|uniref:Uncharacterized protein n=1 Tax=Halopolyspora algeriensis TaxID=1500506 RepID=A0A368VWM6_9ACTN|nr:hypothetical protein [Halopolyspora algeriensis]RCW45138.1 hypothetical protein DFQ14_103102 [Halopolyspora algeriensis]TQM53141.1 hypothetical protein FHU43_2522 [Halopolyspora algeriensis]